MREHTSPVGKESSVQHAFMKVDSWRLYPHGNPTIISFPLKYGPGVDVERRFLFAFFVLGSLAKLQT